MEMFEKGRPFPREREVWKHRALGIMSFQEGRWLSHSDVMIFGVPSDGLASWEMRKVSGVKGWT